jgi:hypothetical protein
MLGRHTSMQTINSLASYMLFGAIACITCHFHMCLCLLVRAFDLYRARIIHRANYTRQTLMQESSSFKLQPSHVSTTFLPHTTKEPRHYSMHRYSKHGFHRPLLHRDPILSLLPPRMPLRLRLMLMPMPMPMPIPMPIPKSQHQHQHATLPNLPPLLRSMQQTNKAPPNPTSKNLNRTSPSPKATLTWRTVTR